MGSRCEADIPTPWSPFIGGLKRELSSMNLSCGSPEAPSLLFVFQLTTVQRSACWWLTQNVTLMHLNHLSGDLWFPGYFVFCCSLVSMLLLLCFSFISYAGYVLLLLSFIHLSFGRICHKFIGSKTVDSRLLKTHPIWQFYYTLTDTFTEIRSKYNPRSFTSCYGDRFQQHS